MLTSSTSSSSLSTKRAGKNGEMREGSAGEDDELQASHLTRPTPDAILADEADPDTLLGDESDSDTGEAKTRDNKSKEGKKGKSARRKSKGAGDSLHPSPNKQDYRRSRQLFDASEAAAAMDGEAEGQKKQGKPLFGRMPSAIGQNGDMDNEDDDDEKTKELRSQLTGLNSKLVASYERIGDLEDDMSQLQSQLAASRAQIETLEKERGQHLAALNTGLLVEKEHVSTEMQKMMERLVQETAEKGKAVDERAKIEAELDDLSSSLFAEANKMVASEKLARAIAEEKSRSMEERLKDTEEIMEQQQKRLVELQGALEEAEARTDPGDDEKNRLGEPSRDRRAPRFSMGPSQYASASGAHIDQLSPLFGAQLRLDVVPYIELRVFLNHLRKLRLQLYPFYSYSYTTSHDESMSRPATPTIARLGSPALGQSAAGNGHSASPFAAADVPRHKDFPSLPANVEQLVHLPSQITSLGFLKRINEEDAEPCLRLDFAPGLNWLSRRQMHSAILEGNLMIEPIFGGGIFNEEEVRAKAIGSAPAACAMCGKIVVNVPLPGGGTASDVSGWASAASSLQASVGGFASSFPGRDATASPPMGTGLFAPSPTTSTAKDSTTSRSKSIFSTLRSISGSGRSFSGSLPTSSDKESPAQQQAAALISNVGAQHPEDPWAGRLAPIPTHIFRINENSSARYLLCPDFCLRRLRATCDLWAYIRALERAVVLEGKFAFDDEQQRSDKQKRASSSSVTRVVELSEDEKNANKEEITTEKPEDDKDVTPTETNHASDASEKADDAKEEDVPAADKSTKAASEASDSESESMHSAADQDGDGAGPRDSSEAGAEDKTAVIRTEESTDENMAGENEKEGGSAGKTAGSTDSEMYKPIVPSKEPPALPPRVPPRDKSAAQSPSPVVPLGPEPRRLLDTQQPVMPLWEEKVWLEVNRLRAELWAARIGVVQPENS